MTYKNIHECFSSDDKLLDYYDPTVNVSSKEEAIMDIYMKMVDHSRDRECEFYIDEIGYIFYSKGLLISFCIKPESRTKENLAYFGNLIKSKLGHHFSCYLFNINRKAIGFLERIGMKKVQSNDLITLLSI